MTIAVMMAIKVMAVATGVVAVAEAVGLDEVAASITAAKNSRKEIDDCAHIKDQYVSNTVYKNYSETEKVNFYELHLACLEKEGPQGERKKYVRKIKSLQRQLD